MPAGVAYKVVAHGTGIVVVGPLSSSTSSCGGLSSVAAAMAVVVYEPSGGSARENILGIGSGCVCWSSTEFSLALIRLGSKVRWTSISWSN